MPRPSMHVDQKLIKAGLKLLSQKGIRGISVRALCQRSNVNLGMFSYCFKTKENYMKILFETARKQLVDFIDLEQLSQLDAYNQVLYCYKKLIDYSFLNIPLMRCLFVEAGLDKELYESYIKKGIIRPIELPYKLIRAAQKEGVLRSDISEYKIHYGIVMSILVPIWMSDCKIFARAENGEGLKIERSEYVSYLNKILKDLEIK